VYPADYPEDAPANATPPTDVPPPSIKMAGFEQLIRGEPIRGKFRKSFEHPEAFVPGKVEEVSFTMPDRNPQVFENIPDAKPEDFKKATEKVYRSKSQPSGIAVQVLP
jgi:hypothetical protein